MHCEQGNKMAFHAIILCNKTPEARKMINNVSCVSQLLPKIKRSSAPSAARLGRKCGRCRSRRSRVPAGAHAAAAPARPLRPAGICRMRRGGQERAPSSGRGQEPPKGSASPAPAAPVARPRHAARLLPPAPRAAPALANAGQRAAGELPALSRARGWPQPGPEQEALRAPRSSLLMLSPPWQGMSKLLLVNLTSRALFQEQQ